MLEEGSSNGVDRETRILGNLVSFRLFANSHKVMQSREYKRVLGPRLLSLDHNRLILLDTIKLSNWFESVIV